MLGQRTQPYRLGSPMRMPGMALQAMMQGRQPGFLNGADYDRLRRQQAMAPTRTSDHFGDQTQADQQQSLRELAMQQLQQAQHQRPPVATADVRGTFGAPQQHWNDPRVQELVASLLGRRRTPGPMLGPGPGAVGPRY